MSCIISENGISKKKKKKSAHTHTYIYIYTHTEIKSGFASHTKPTEKQQSWIYFINER